MSRILFLAPQIPYPPHQGTTLRNFNLIKGLAQRHQITLVAYAAGSNLQAPAHQVPAKEQSMEGSLDYGPLVSLCQRIVTVPEPPPRKLTRRLAGLLAPEFSPAVLCGRVPKPDLVQRLDSAMMQQQVRTVLSQESFDIVQLEGLEMSGFLLDPITLAPSRKLPAGTPALRHRLVYDAHNAEFLLQKRAWETDRTSPRRWIAALYSMVQTRRLAAWESRLCRKADAVAAVSHADARALHDLAPTCHPLIVPNGVDTRYYTYTEALARQVSPPSPLTMVFTGKMDFRPNVDAIVWFVAEVLPRVQQQRPNAHLWVVGQKPHARLLSLAHSRNGQPRSDITITGAVPDTRPYIAAATLVVMPLRVGGGTRLKVLEAMSMGRPIVATSLACEGLEVRHNQEALLSSDASIFAQHILTLAEQPALAARLGASARKQALACYDWQRIIPLMEAAYGP